MLQRIRLLCGLSGVSWSFGPGKELDVPHDVDEGTAARLVASGAAVAVAVEAPAVAPPVPIIETATVHPPEAAVAPRGRGKGNRR